ncbi:signal peptidase I [Streptomyces sp. ADI98-10]|uniref:signal peptidase I n=1 Tax=Streptomyces sp. ADI98-10 TaxID=1522763 RepID=UPI000F555E8E|nr:signal peptidase I [Streptomyces sp. ADI98-10]RPK85028.1 Signal peptidase I U [Streptomyces sp. ADI98-10]
MQWRGTGGGLRKAAWVLVPVGAVLAVGSIGYFFANYQGASVMGQAMEPTYRMGERLLVERIDAGEIRRGDVLLVEVPGRYAGAPVLQRAIGTGGDHVVCDGEQITVNGQPVDEPYVMRGEVNPGTGPYDVRVPEGRLFLLGDDRANANDSRFFLDERSGSVAASGVIGRVQSGAAALPPAALALLGILLTLTGVGLGIGGYAAGRNSRPAVPPWPVA